MDPVTRFVIDHLVGFTSSIIMPLMLFAFVGGVLVRLMIYYVARAEYRFTYEFEKRVRFMTKDMHEDPSKKVTSFQSLVKQLLLKTYYESFELKHRYKRRNYDHISSVSDRMFLVQEGAARIVGDLLKQTRYIKRDSNNNTKMIDMVKNVFDNNPYFNRLMGIVPVGLMNELTSILPGLLIIGGIFGTFLGISRGLPELSAMDLSKIDETKKIMDDFLVHISQAMVKSIIGIALSVVMSLVNTILSAEGIYYNLINRFSSSLEQLWNETTTNEYESDEKVFDFQQVAGQSAEQDKRAA